MHLSSYEWYINAAIITCFGIILWYVIKTYIKQQELNFEELSNLIKSVHDKLSDIKTEYAIYNERFTVIKSEFEIIKTEHKELNKRIENLEKTHIGCPNNRK